MPSAEAMLFTAGLPGCHGDAAEGMGGRIGSIKCSMMKYGGWKGRGGDCLVVYCWTTDKFLFCIIKPVCVGRALQRDFVW